MLRKREVKEKSGVQKEREKGKREEMPTLFGTDTDIKYMNPLFKNQKYIVFLYL